MKISIVTISFNQSRFIEKAIESVLAQSYQDLEYIIVDAGSTDGSREIIERYRGRVTSVIFEPDAGPADGLNRGFRAASGHVLGFLNADDIFMPGAISLIANSFAHMPHVDVIMGNGYQIDEGGRTVRKIFSTSWSLRRYAYGAFNMVQQATFFRREAFTRVGGFNAGNRICWDGELLVDMALEGAKFARISQFLGGFRIYSTSITGSGGQQGAAFLTEKTRIAEKALSRPWSKLDGVLSVLFLFRKYVSHPVVSFHGVLWRLTRLLSS